MNKRCEYTDENGASCDDGDTCTEGDLCSGGSCSGTSKSCDDSDACTTDSCDSATGACSHRDKDCSDDNPCTTDSCDESGSCVHKDNSADCDDGDECTKGDSCQGGSCVPGADTCGSGCDRDRDCDDGDPATIDECVGGSCEHSSFEDLGGAETPNWTEPESYEENYTILIEVDPDPGIYVPGQRVETAKVTITDSSGAPVERASVSGVLNGTDAVTLDFDESGGGTYRAQIGYIISSDENGLIPLRVSASIGGQEAPPAIKYLVIGSSKYFYLIPEKPTQTEVARGQVLDFQAMVTKRGELDTLESVQVVLIDERTDEKSTMLEGESGHYAADVRIKKNTFDSAHFIVFATALVNGVERSGGYKVTLTAKPILSLAFDKSGQDPKTGVLKINIHYVDEGGSEVADSEVRALITSYPSGEQQTLVLTKLTDVFSGMYLKTPGDTSAKIQVIDSYGNAGEALLPSEFFASFQEFPMTLVIIPILIVIGGIFAFKSYQRSKSRMVAARIEKSKLLARKAELENLIKRTRLDFYKRAITHDEADARLLEYDEELKLIEAKMRGG